MSDGEHAPVAAQRVPSRPSGEGPRMEPRSGGRSTCATSARSSSRTTTRSTSWARPPASCAGARSSTGCCRDAA